VFLPTYLRVWWGKSHPKSSVSEGGKAGEESNGNGVVNKNYAELSDTLT